MQRDNKISPWLDNIKKKGYQKFLMRGFKGFSKKQVTLNTDRYIPRKISSEIFDVYLKEDEIERMQKTPNKKNS